MAKVQKKSSLCNEKIQCTCKSFEELQRIKLVIFETARYFWIAENPKDDTYDLINLLKEHIIFQQKQIKGFVKSMELLHRMVESKKETTLHHDPGNGRIIHLPINKSK